jgi:hypothetical protein
MLQVSYVKLVQKLPAVEGWTFHDRIELLESECCVMISHAQSFKCPRCWTYAAEIEGELCERCLS